MNYQIQSGDSLWSIVKSNYNLTDNTEISNKVNELAKANNIENPDMIYAGCNISLFGLGDDTSQKTGDGFEKSKADEFEDWDKENQKNYSNGSNTSEFKMFDFNPKTYSKNLKDFAQEYINKFDEDKNGSWNEAEFIKMASNNKKNTSAEEKNLFKKLFAALNLDNKKDDISAEEFATQLYISDLNLENYAKTKDVVSSLDGKFSFEEYHGMSFITQDDDSFKEMQKQKLDFFNNFYNKL